VTTAYVLLIKKPQTAPCDMSMGLSVLCTWQLMKNLSKKQKLT